MANYLVKSPITHGHSNAKKDKDGNFVSRDHIREYKPGDVAQFTEEEAAAMPHAVQLIAEDAPAKSKKKE